MTIMQGIILTAYIGTLVLFGIGVVVSPNNPIKDGVINLISWIVMFWIYSIVYWGFFIFMDIQFGFLKWF